MIPLSVIIMVAGAAVLALEIIAGRYLVPPFGSSLYNWGAILSVTLVCLAIGYRWAGRLGDQLDRCRPRLAAHLFAAAIWIALLTVLGPLGLRLSRAAGSALGPMVAVTLLFAVPLTLLATATPLAIAERARNDRTHLGRAVGDYFAISTAGSVAGALLAAYVLVPRLGITHSFLALAAAIVAVCLGDLTNTLLRRIGLGALVVAIGAKIVFGPTPFAALTPGVTRVASLDSRYGHIDILDDDRDGSRILVLDGASQNHAYGPDYRRSAFDYIPMLAHHVGRYHGSGGKALVLGMGGGAIVPYLRQAGFEIDIVDIDPAMVTVAHTYFGFDDAEANAHVADARVFIEEAVMRKRKYHAVIVNVAAGGGYPEHLYSKEAYLQIVQLLEPSGVYACNMMSTTAPLGKEIAHSVATLRSVFDHVAVLDVSVHDNSTGIGEFLLFASPHPARRPFQAIAGERPFEVSEGSLRPLTDDWNPMSSWSSHVSAAWHDNIETWLGPGAVIPW